MSDNRERAEEKGQGKVRWLRPTYQLGLAEKKASAKQGTLKIQAKQVTQKIEWPKSMSEQAQVLLEILSRQKVPVTIQDLANAFKGMNKARATELLNTLSMTGRVVHLDGVRYLAQ